MTDTHRHVGRHESVGRHVGPVGSHCVWCGCASDEPCRPGCYIDLDEDMNPACRTCLDAFLPSDGYGAVYPE